MIRHGFWDDRRDRLRGGDQVRGVPTAADMATSSRAYCAAASSPDLGEDVQELDALNAFRQLDPTLPARCVARRFGCTSRCASFGSHLWDPSSGRRQVTHLATYIRRVLILTSILNLRNFCTFRAQIAASAHVARHAQRGICYHVATCEKHTLATSGFRARPCLTSRRTHITRAMKGYRKP